MAPPREAYEAREKNGFAGGPLNMKESIDLIIELTKHRTLTTIIIDALDECHSSERDNLLDALSRLLQESVGLVKIFVSSRDDQGIACHLADCLNLRIEAAKNQPDIVRFVDLEVDQLIAKKRLLDGNISEILKVQIKEALNNGAQGM